MVTRQVGLNKDYRLRKLLMGPNHVMLSQGTGLYNTENNRPQQLVNSLNFKRRYSVERDSGLYQAREVNPQIKIS